MCCSTIPSPPCGQTPRRCSPDQRVTSEIGRPSAWKNQTILINDYYTRIILGLSDHHWDYNIADDQYIENARIEGNELVIGPQRFRAIILPPITTLSRVTLKKLQEFHRPAESFLAYDCCPPRLPKQATTMQ